MTANEAQREPVDNRDIYDITFIGAGPVALYGMYYAGLRLTRFKAIDPLEETGGALTALYPEKYIYDVGGFPKITAKELAQHLHEQATQYPHTLCLGERVESLERGDDGILSITTQAGVHFSRTVIICAGLGAFTPRKLELPDVERLDGHGIYYAVRRKADFAGRRVLIVGGGDSAFDYSMMLEPVAKSITHIHRNSFFSAHEDSIRKVQASTVEMRFPFWEVKAIHGDDHVTGATIHQTKTGEEIDLEIDAIIFNLGWLTSLGPIVDWGLTLDGNAIAVDRRMRTNIEGVYAAGDICTYDGKLKLISLGFGEVAIAVNNAKNYVDPRAKVAPGHSTDKHEIALKKASRKTKQNQPKELAVPPTKH